MLIKSIMRSEVACCAPDASIAAAARIMSHSECGILPVVDGEQKLLGVITDRDICLAVAIKPRMPDEILVREVMTKKVYTCTPDTRVESALGVMKNRAVRRLPVVMADGRVKGVVSIDDLVVRADSHENAAVADDDVLDTLKSICARTLTA